MILSRGMARRNGTSEVFHDLLRIAIGVAVEPALIESLLRSSLRLGSTP